MEQKDQPQPIVIQANQVHIAAGGISQINIVGGADDQTSGAQANDSQDVNQAGGESGGVIREDSTAFNNASVFRGSNQEQTGNALQRNLSTEPPTGPGWYSLSENIRVSMMKPIEEGVQVYRGKQNFAGKWRDVAVKLIPYDEKNLKEVKLHLEFEEHPNIIRLFTAGQTMGFPPQIYIVMELCPQTLKDFIDEQKQKPFDFEQCFSYAKQIVCGVAFIHTKKILHRDIKLRNILLSPSKEFIRVADFGLSKQLKEGCTHASVSFHGLGSDGYRAPEMLDEEPKASFHSDSFSLGVVLCMLFSNGHHPFGPDPRKWRNNIMERVKPDLSSIHDLKYEEPCIRKIDQLADLIGRSLRAEPSKRPTPAQMLRHPFFTEMMDVENQSEAEKQDCIKLLEGFLKKPLHSIGYPRALRILERLRRTRGTDDLHLLLQILECHLHLMSEKRGSFMEEVTNYISDARSKSWDLKELADEFYENEHYVKALILYKQSHDMHKKEPSVSCGEEIKWIRYRIYDMYWTIKPLTETDDNSRIIAKIYGVIFMKAMLQELRAMATTKTDDKTLNVLACIVQIVDINNRLGEYAESARIGEEAVAMVTEQFAEKSSNYYRYGWLWHHLGTAYRNLGQYDKSTQCYNTALKIKESATDYENAATRQKDIKLTKQKLAK